jgi:hypothetical protein
MLDSRHDTHNIIKIMNQHKESGENESYFIDNNKRSLLQHVIVAAQSRNHAPSSSTQGLR